MRPPCHYIRCSFSLFWSPTVNPKQPCDTFEMTTFQYPSFNTETMPIRLLHLGPGEFSDPIHVELRNAHIPIGDKTDRYALAEPSIWVYYEALSYAWGSTSNQKPILVDDAAGDANTILVTENLELALRHLRRRAESRTLWIDAVCIDQNNIEERNQQVSMMGNVYARASQVLVWLGPEENDSDHAMELLQYLGERVDADPTTGTLRLSDLGRGEPELADRSVALPFDERELRSIGHFFSRPWFERLWVRQEVSCKYIFSDSKTSMAPPPINSRDLNSTSDYLDRDVYFCYYSMRLEEYGLEYFPFCGTHYQY